MPTQSCRVLLSGRVGPGLGLGLPVATAPRPSQPLDGLGHAGPVNVTGHAVAG